MHSILDLASEKNLVSRKNYREAFGCLGWFIPEPIIEFRVMKLFLLTSLGPCIKHRFSGIMLYEDHVECRNGRPPRNVWCCYEKNKKGVPESGKQDTFTSGTGFYFLSILDCVHLSLILFCEGSNTCTKVGV